jgi:hypothetical protein
MLAVGVLLCLAPAARAGTYEMWSCAGPDGKPVAAEGWRVEGHGVNSSPSNACASGQGLYAGLSGGDDHAANSEILTWHFQVPSTLKIASYRLWRAARVEPNSGNASPVYWMARQSNQYIGAYVVPSENCPGWQCRGLGDVNGHYAAANLVAERGLSDVRDLFLNAGCGGSPGTSCLATAGPAPDTVYFHMYRAAIVLQDDNDPVFTSPPSGSLTAGGTLAGLQGVSFSASDVGSGVYHAEIEVDGHTMVQQGFGCAPPFTAIVPCKPAAGGSLSFDTAALADGVHIARVLVSDATGTNTAAFGPFTITTANEPARCAPAASPSFTVGFDHKRRTIRRGGRLNVLGQLAGAVAGTQVRVVSRVRRAGARTRVLPTPLVTDAEGRFTYRVPAGPSRVLRFAHRVPLEPLYACSKALKVAVRARVALAAKPRTVSPGGRVRFRGRLRGGYLPKRGKLVELQAYDRGRWRSVRTVRANRKGRFHYRYRFSFRAGGTTYPFRAVVRPDAGYPWARGTSRRVRIHVR